MLQFEKEMPTPDVAECYHISGDYDYILNIHVSDMEAYREFMVNKLTALNHIGCNQSCLAITEVKHTTAANLQVKKLLKLVLNKNCGPGVILTLLQL